MGVAFLSLPFLCFPHVSFVLAIETNQSYDQRSNRQVVWGTGSGILNRWKTSSIDCCTVHKNLQLLRNAKTCQLTRMFRVRHRTTLISETQQFGRVWMMHVAQQSSRGWLLQPQFQATFQTLPASPKDILSESYCSLTTQPLLPNLFY